MTNDQRIADVPQHSIDDLITVMAALRTPVTGCPWDLEQTFATIAPYTLEEAYEVAEAIARGDMANLEEELGDLLLQVVYHARMAEEAGTFRFAHVVDRITAKMIRRHPHVFGDEVAGSAEAVNGLWDRIKAEEKAAKASANGGQGTGPLACPSLLADVPLALPALVRAIKLQDKAAKVGFDWPSLAPVFAKMREELIELEEVALAADPRGGGKQYRGSPTVMPEACLQQSELPARDAVPGPDLIATTAPLASSFPAKAGSAHRASDAVGSETATSTAFAASGRFPGGESVAADQSLSSDAIKEEFGDLLFVMANVARHLKIDAEDALRGANAKFTRRFQHIEARLAEDGRTPTQSTLEEMDRLWDEVRAADKLTRR